jgi:hypothetical protein
MAGVLLVAALLFWAPLKADTCGCTLSEAANGDCTCAQCSAWAQLGYSVGGCFAQCGDTLQSPDWDAVMGCFTNTACGVCVFEGTAPNTTVGPIANNCDGQCFCGTFTFAGWAGTVVDSCIQPSGGGGGDCPEGYPMGPCGCGTTDVDGDGCCPEQYWPLPEGGYGYNPYPDCNDLNANVCQNCDDPQDPCADPFQPGCFCFDNPTDPACECIDDPECDWPPYNDPCELDPEGLACECETDPQSPACDQLPCERLGGDADGDGCCAVDDVDDEDPDRCEEDCVNRGGDEDEDGCCADVDPDDEDPEVGCDCECDLARGPLGEWYADLEEKFAAWQIIGEPEPCEPFVIELELPFRNQGLIEFVIPCNFIPELPGNLGDKVEDFRRIIRGYLLLVLAWQTLLLITRILLTW